MVKGRWGEEGEEGVGAGGGQHAVDELRGRIFPEGSGRAEDQALKVGGRGKAWCVVFKSDRIGGDGRNASGPDRLEARPNDLSRRRCDPGPRGPASSGTTDRAGTSPRRAVSGGGAKRIGKSDGASGRSATDQSRWRQGGSRSASARRVSIRRSAYGSCAGGAVAGLGWGVRAASVSRGRSTAHVSRTAGRGCDRPGGWRSISPSPPRTYREGSGRNRSRGSATEKTKGAWRVQCVWRVCVWRMRCVWRVRCVRRMRCVWRMLCMAHACVWRNTVPTPISSTMSAIRAHTHTVSRPLAGQHELISKLRWTRVDGLATCNVRSIIKRLHATDAAQNSRITHQLALLTPNACAPPASIRPFVAMDSALHTADRGCFVPWSVLIRSISVVSPPSADGGGGGLEVIQRPTTGGDQPRGKGAPPRATAMRACGKRPRATRIAHARAARTGKDRKRRNTLWIYYS